MSTGVNRHSKRATDHDSKLPTFRCTVTKAEQMAMNLDVTAPVRPGIDAIDDEGI